MNELLTTTIFSSQLLVNAAAAENARTAGPTNVEVFLKENCTRCHGEKKSKGGMKLQTLNRDFSSGVDANTRYRATT